MPYHTTVVCNTHKQDCSTLQIYPRVSCVVFGCDNLEVNSRCTAFTLKIIHLGAKRL